MIKNVKLREYLETEIVKYYNRNDKGHDINHLKAVINYAERINLILGNPIDNDMLMTAIYFHDVACGINRSEHNYFASIMVKNNKVLKEVFTKEQIELIAKACYEHRSKLEKTTLLSRIVSDADKADACRIDRMIYRAWYYGRKYYPETVQDDLIVRCHSVQNKKYGKNSYFNFELEETKYIVKDDLIVSRKILDDYELFESYARKMINEGILVY
jgi:uncharacterized protein